VVLALYLEDVPYHTGADGAISFDTEPIMEVSAEAFVLGCALGLEFPDRVSLILEQTHPGEVDAIIADCAGPLEERVADARESGAEIGPEVFLESLLDALEESGPVEADVAYNVISIGFEYGCILARVERRAALSVRNGFNRAQATLAQAAAHDKQATGGNGDDQVPADPGGIASVQELARELLLAYEQETGFGQATAS
jgi:hypothetical protein